MSAICTLDTLALKPPAPNMTQTDLYRSMRTEAAKLESTSAQVDWTDVMALSQRVLEQLGQDLLAAAYWAHARHMCAGVAALPSSLDAVSQLLEEAWLHMSPPLTRLKGRAGAVEWLVEHTTRALQRPGLNSAALDTTLLAAAVKRLQRAAQSRLQERAPGFAKLRAAVERQTATHAPVTPMPLPEAIPNPKKPPPVVVAAASAVPKPIAPAEGMRLSALGELICAQALELRRTEPQSATALRLVRTGLWLHIDKAPPHVSGVTRIAPLPSGVRATLCEHKTHKRWQTLLDEVEKQILKHRMHLDLQRDAALALRNLGAAYAESLAAVEDEVRSFINRVSELPNLQAADKSPLADDATKAWLQKLTQVASASAPAAAPQPITAHLSPTQANKMIPSDALSHFLQRLQHAEAAAEQGHKPVALALFRGLHRQLIKKRLLEWDNALSTRALVGFWRCLQFMPKESQLAEVVFEQIARINPKLATEIS